MEIQTPIQLRLVPLDNLRRSSEIADSLQVDNCLSRDLSRMGFAIVEQKHALARCDFVGDAALTLQNESRVDAASLD